MNIAEQFKKGWYTSEFWIGLVTMGAPIVAALTGYDFDTEGAVAVIGGVFSGATYIASRTWLKRARLQAVVAEAAATPATDDPAPSAGVDVGQTDPAVIPPAG